MTQRWIRPLDVEPGHWKDQLPTKILELAVQGKVPPLRDLLAEHPNYLNHKGGHGRTLLWEAVRKGRFEAVRFLVEAGADVNIPGRYNRETRVMLSPYSAAYFYKRMDIAEYLTACGVNEDIFRLAFRGDDVQVRQMLAVQPDLLNAEDPHDHIYYMPLLAFAIAGSHADLTKYLLTQDAVVWQYSAQLLPLAARLSRVDLLDMLIAHGADVQAVDASIYIDVDDIAMIRYLLEHGAPVNALGRSGIPPLVYVARGDRGKRPDKVEALLAYGADVNVRNHKGRTALHNAAKAGFIDVMQILLDHGATINVQDAGGKTPLDLARRAKRDEAVKLLLSNI